LHSLAGTEQQTDPFLHAKDILLLSLRKLEKSATKKDSRDMLLTASGCGNAAYQKEFKYDSELAIRDFCSCITCIA